MVGYELHERSFMLRTGQSVSPEEAGLILRFLRAKFKDQLTDMFLRSATISFEMRLKLVSRYRPPEQSAKDYQPIIYPEQILVLSKIRRLTEKLTNKVLPKLALNQTGIETETLMMSKLNQLFLSLQWLRGINRIQKRLKYVAGWRDHPRLRVRQSILNRSTARFSLLSPPLQSSQQLTQHHILSRLSNQ